MVPVQLIVRKSRPVQDLARRRSFPVGLVHDRVTLSTGGTAKLV
jgi:hypothetical protein